MRVLTTLPQGDLRQTAAAARACEAAGYDAVMTMENKHDPFLAHAIAAVNTDRIELGTNVAIAFPRNPVQLAHQAWDLQLLSGGRFTLGLGSQIRAQVERRYGVAFERPVERMREWIGALRAIFATWETGAPLDFRGEFTSHTLMPPTFVPEPSPHGAPPIALGGLGPRMVSLAAEVADGLLVMPFNTAAHFRARTLPAVADGLARGGRSRDALTVTGEVIVSCGRTEEELTAAQIPYEVGIARYRELARGQIVGDANGLLKLLVDPATRRLLGVHAFGTGATEIVHIGQTVMGLGGTVDYLVNAVFNFPTLSEAYKVAALDAVNKMRAMSRVMATRKAA